MQPLRAFTLRNYITLTFIAAAAFAVLGSGLSPVSGSRDISNRLSGPGGSAAVRTLPSGNDAGITLNPSAGTSRNPRSDALALLRTVSQAGPTAAALTATKTDNTSTPVNPGDTIMYTIEITNTGDANATNVNFTDTIDANTALVPGSVAVAPIAVNDAYNTIGNVNIQVPVGQGVIANDLNPNGSGTLSVTLVNATPVPGTAATTNGSVTMASDGSFTYTPNAGFGGPTDSFTYTLSNSATPGKTDTATVTIAIAGRIWFVNSAAGVNGDGRLNTPFNILTGAGSADSVDAANDVIFLYTSGTTYTGGITLNSGEKIIGQGASQSILTITGFTAPSGTNLLPGTAGADPVITTAGTTAITLGTNNGLHGFTVGNTAAAGTDISGTSFGTLTVRDVTVNGSGRALNLATGTIAAGSTFDLIESNGGSTAEGVRLNAVGGSFTAPTTNIVNPTGTGIDVQSSPAGTSFSFGATTVNKGASAGTGVNLNANSGTFSFSSLAVTTNNGTGVSATSSGTVNVTTGSIAATGGPGLLVNPTTLSMTFTSVSSTNSATTGISLTSASGSLSIGTTSITNPAGIGISVNTSSATLNFGNATSTQSGGTGVSLTSNTGTITFGALNASPDASQKGLVATENTNTVTTTSGAITTNTNTAVEITKASGATPLVVSLTSVSANGGANGIVLTNTSGSFTVVGDGTNTNNGSGGIIQNTTSAGISLTTVQNISLTALNIHDIGRSGIDGQGVVNFTMARSTINNVGTAAAGQYEESNIAFNDGGVFTSSSVSGTVSITQSTLTNARRHGIQIENGSGTISNLTISNNTITSSTNATVSLGTAVLVLIQGSASTAANLTTGTVSNNTINNFPSAEGIAVLGGIGSATNNTSTTLGANGTPINITSNTINGGATRMGSNAIRVSFNGKFGVSNFNISNNPTLTNFQGLGISAFFGGTVTGTTTINNNVVVSNQTIGAGSSGIAVQADDGPDGLGTADPDVNITINNNNVSANEGNCIRGIARATNRATMDLTIQNNTVTAPTLANRNGIRVDSGSAAGDTNLCLLMTGNTSAGSGVNQGIGIRKQLTNAAVNVFGIIGLAPSPTTGANAAAKVAADNPAGGGVDVISGDNFVNCAQTASPTFGAKSEESAQASGAQDSTTDDAVDSVGRDGTLKAHHGEMHGKDDVKPILQQELIWTAQQTIQRWRDAGMSAEELAGLDAVTFELADLPEGQLASISGKTVKIDATAAGYGWYFDQIPADDSEFDVPVFDRERQTTEYSPAFEKMDLMTVLMRELGTVYLQGKDRIPKSLRPVLNPLLLPGVRRMPVFNVPDRSTSRVSPAASQSSNANVAVAAPTQPSTDSSTSLLDLRPAVFNPTADLMPGNYGQSARRMTYTPTARRVAQIKGAPSSGETVNLGPFTLPPGEKIVIMFSATVNAANTFPPGTTQVCNQGSVSADGIPAFLTDDPDVVGSNNPTCTALNVADVSVTKSAGSSPVCSTSNITFTINYSNAGPASAVDATVSDAMPVGTSLVSVTTPATWTRTDSVPAGGNGTITFTKASSPNPDAAVFTIVVSIDASVTDGTVIQNTASVTSTTPDPNTANNTTAPTSTTVKKPPTTATVGGPQTICALGTTASLGGNTPVIGTGTWTVQSGGTGTFNPSATTPGATFTHLTGTGPIVLRWTISNPPCADSFAEVTITVNAQPTATVGGPQTICALGTTASLGGNTPSGGATGTWSIVTAGVTGTFNPDANTPGATFTHTTGGIGTTITLRWTVSNPPCTDATADVLITIKSQPTATVGGPQTICAGGTTAGLGGNTPAAGETGTWTIVTAGVTGTFNPTANTPNATFTHAAGGSPSFILRWTVSNPPCTSATADVTISLLPAPVATTGGPQTICELGTTASLGGNTPAAGETGTWSIVTAGVTGTFNPDANTPGATFTHISGGAGGTITLRWTVTNPTCGQSATADAIITVKQQPTATVGGPQTICALGTTAGLGGNTPAGGATGTWTIVTGGATGTFNPSANTPNATFTHTGGTGTITLRWTVSNPPCSDATADVAITITQQPTVASVGGPQTICALGTTAGLGGNTPTSGTGTWTVQSGGTGTFNPGASTPDATFTHTGGAGPIVLRWTIANPPCPDSFAEVTVTITQAPSTATVGGPQTICDGSTTAGLGGNTPASGIGSWTVQSGGTGTFSPTANTPNATFTPTSGPGTITLRWTIANPPCPDSFAEVIITVKQQPTATVGGPQTICALGTTAGLGGNTPTGGAIGTWTIVTGGATGTFNPNANTPNATFTHSGGTGTITLRWTVSNPPCLDATADVAITITQPPTTATVGPNQIIPPGGTTAGLGGNTPTSGTGLWSIVTAGATGTFNPDASTPNATWTHLTGSGFVVLRWTITNPPCPASFAEVTIQIGIPPAITCPASPVIVSTAPGQCSATVTFTVTATGVPVPTVTCVPPSGSVFPKGNTTVNCTATNGIPPDATCSFTVTVNDTEPPAITCPANITQSTDPNLCSAVVTYPAPTVTDNCPCSENGKTNKTKKNGKLGLTTCQVACDPPSGSTFPKGTTTVTCTATDLSGNQSMCGFTVTVNDTQPPVITCPANITIKTPQPGDPCVVVNYPAPVVTDNCPDPTVVCNPPSGSCFPLGTTTVTCTATDTSGNTATCTFTVKVFDLCLQDDSNPNTVLLFNSTTGEYRFCCNGVTFVGQGTVTQQGSIFKLQHNSTDRRLLATVDESQHRGTASLQAPPGVNRCTIIDRNTQNNSCVCQ